MQLGQHCNANKEGAGQHRLDCGCPRLPPKVGTVDGPKRGRRRVGGVAQMHNQLTVLVTTSLSYDQAGIMYHQGSVRVVTSTGAPPALFPTVVSEDWIWMPYGFSSNISGIYEHTLDISDGF